ncbi:inactive beta-amylase 9 [Malania oleifera]|uniref:inactive beta-amylase 9 n=1 Tax=Malania oleifera TaxID=397392 RepID=UPI0025AE8D9E|nr:inactive beta-amylase 9 [Malania oleifera]
MEVSVIGSSQAKSGRTSLGFWELRFGNPSAKFFGRRNQICFGQSTRWRRAAGIRFTLNAVQTEALKSEKVVRGNTSTLATRSKAIDGVRLYVGLPLDSVSDCNTLNHARAIAAGLKALKLLGVDGVELPVWWGIAEKEAMGKYEWSGYLSLAEMVQKVGLKLHVSLCFHASKDPKIPLPEWVSRIGETEPSIFFTDRSGKQYKDCLSLAVDDLPVLNGKTPVQAYEEFCESFKSSFSQFMGSTITGISMGLGPDGELRYPSHHRLAKGSRIPGVGEFQCYDKNMLHILKQHADATGNPYWGLGGPHDTPNYDQSPNLNNFFKEHAGSWETPYGDFFLSWYSNQLISHGNRLLSVASTVFSDCPVKISGKVPLMHSWYKTRPHASELTAGYYNTGNRDGYEATAEMFARSSCKMILPGMDLADEHQPSESLSSPELLLAQIKKACRKHGVEVSGQNSSVSGAPGGFEQIKKNLVGENAVMDLFTYQRMGAYFFSPKHFPSFTEFARNFNQPGLHSDDLPADEEEPLKSPCVNPESGKSLRMQAA